MPKNIWVNTSWSPWDRWIIYDQKRVGVPAKVCFHQQLIPAHSFPLRAIPVALLSYLTKFCAYISPSWSYFYPAIQQAAERIMLQHSIDRIHQRDEQSSKRLILEICQVMKKILKFDCFIQKQLNLLKLWQHYLQENVYLLPISLAETIDFASLKLDPHSLLDRLVRLSTKFIRSNYLWAQRRHLIERPSLVSDILISYIKLEEYQETREANLLEYKT